MKKSGYHFKLTNATCTIRCPVQNHFQILYKTNFSTECVMAVFTLQYPTL